MRLTFLAKTIAIILAAGLLMQANAFCSAVYEWNAGTGNWSNPENWNVHVSTGDPPPVPSIDDPAEISNGGTAQITGTAATANLVIAARSIKLGRVEILAGGTLAVGNVEMARVNGSDASLVIRGGALVTFPGYITFSSVATGSDSSGTIVVSEGGLFSITHDLTLGRQTGQATLQIGEGGAAGTVAAERIIGQGTGGGSGSVVFNHNELNYTFGTQIGDESSSGASSSVVGVVQDGPGVTTLTHTNYYLLGTELNAGVLAVSANANLGAASGALTFGGGTLRTTAGFAMNRATVVNAGGGTLEVTTGTLTHQGVFSGAGLLAKTGLGTLSVTGTSSQTGGLSVKEGKLVIGDATTEGSLTAGTGIGAAVTLDGGEFEVFRGTVTGATGEAGAASAGNGGTAFAQIAAGNITNSGTIRGGIGGSASVGSGGATGGNGGIGATISAPTLLVNSGLIAGGSGGSATTGLGVSMGGAGNTGLRWTSTGTVVNTGTVAGGDSGVGIISGTGGAAIQMSGGGVLENGVGGTISGGLGLIGRALGVEATGTAGTLVNKGIIRGGVSMGNFANEVTLHTSSAIDQGGLQMGSSTAAHLTLDGSGAQNLSTAVGSTLSFSGSLTKVGSGTWTIDRANTYSGGTKILAGTFIITDVGPGASALGTGTVTVGQNGKLAGIGTVLGETHVAGTLAPGNSPGQMTFADGLFLESTAVVQMELANLTTFDEITVNGLLTYDGTLSITLLGGYTPQVGDTFDLFDAANVAAGSQFDAVIFNVAGYTGNVNQSTGILTITAVPEPTAAALCLVAGVVFLRRRRIAAR